MSAEFRPYRPPASASRLGERDWFVIRFGRDLEAHTIESVLAHIATGTPKGSELVLEVFATTRDYEHRLGVPSGRSSELLAQLRAALPLRIQPSERREEKVVVGADLRLVGGDGLVRTVEETSVSRSVLASMRPSSGEVVWLQWVLRRGGVGPGEPSWGNLIEGQWRQLAGRPLIRDDKAIATKAARPQLACSLRIAARASTSARATHLVRVVAAALNQTRSNTTFFKTRVSAGEAIADRMSAARSPARTTNFRLTPQELVPILGWPIGDAVMPGLHLGASRHLPADPSIPAHGLVLGRSTLPGAERALAIAPDMLAHHVAVTSPIGTGKSTLIGRMALQAIGLGMGTVVIDWKGDLARDLIDRLPSNYAGRVVVVDPTARDAVVGLPNPLNAPVSERDRQVDQFIGFLGGSWESTMGNRTTALVQAGLFTLARAGGVAVVDLPELLTNRPFRRAALARATDRTGLADFWANFDAMSEAERGQVVAPTLNRTRPWLLRRDVRHLLGQVESTWRMDDVLNGGVLVVNLASGMLGDEMATLLGALIISELMSAIRRRASMPERSRRGAIAVLDEFQRVLGIASGFADDLVMARGLRVGFLMAHQHLGQLTPDIRDTLAANARTRVAFQLRAGDAATVARDLGVLASDLEHLAAYEAIARVATRSGVSSPVSMMSLPFDPPVGAGAAIRRASQARFAVRREEIDRQIAERYAAESGEGDAPIGSRRRKS